MIRATQEDKGLVVSILSESFKENQSVNFIVRQDDIKLNRIRSLMDYSFEVCHLFGEVWLSDDRKACALTLFPHQKRTTLKSIRLDIRLIIQAIGLSGIQKTLNRETEVKKLQSKEKMIYLWFIGVEPVYQKGGIGGNLLKEIIADANKKSLPICLETSTVKNLPWYEHFGFEIYNKLELGYTLFFLKREPDK
ncbi:GNAT family N-acetyltransferase [Mucilaginibacter sp. L3T2-6]|uniref:GNAT family N-acetyltransferase n=1 Tax=Mucilaginibacter sp. L3T2-6 TaxID=3062491 RepID=UPI002674F514|nr:GNAT family N-acetyltransferase [Mucilaginibacter sp. L3T2-6]MDO3641527.1 GNAT family N-acetyltransferase [Mucilaginibacter sp. L3T2-6]MDV6213712.1 GNAT family N-acetyltransferase [Mucilaginibacter sp. L3T2-6]